MNLVNILKLVLGGIVAILSAIGTTLTVLMIAEIYASRQRATGLGAVAGGVTMLLHSVWFWLAVLVIFALGFFLAYRKLYM